MTPWDFRGDVLLALGIAVAGLVVSALRSPMERE